MQLETEHVFKCHLKNIKPELDRRAVYLRHKDLYLFPTTHNPSDPK
jgi:hypothetical protein